MTTRDPIFDNLPAMLKQVKTANPLPKAEGKIVHVSTPWDIVHAIEDAEENSTIIIAKGRYVMPRDTILSTHHVTIRGETGNREDVILDGDTEFDDQYVRLGTRLMSGTVRAPAILKLTRCRHVTIADVTFANSPKYGIMYVGDSRVHHLTIHNVKFHNCWARGFKGTGTSRIDHMPFTKEELGYDPTAQEHIEWNRPRHGIVRHCLFINDHIKRNDDDGFDGDYLAGMDVMGIKEFHVHDNVFVGIRGKNGGGRGSIFIWINAEDVIVENNLFMHCDKAISLGNPSGPEWDISNSVVRNNTIVGGSNKGIEIQHGDNIDVHDNRICSSDRKEFHAIQIQDIHNKARVYNNIIQTDPMDTFNCCDAVEIGENKIGDFINEFKDIESGDLRM